MSENKKANRKTNQENENNVGTTQSGETTEKTGFFTRIYDGAKKTVVKIKSTKGGRIVIKVLKGAGIGAGLYGAYRLGAKSVVPTTVVIESGEDQEEPEKEEPMEETTTEEESTAEE